MMMPTFGSHDAKMMQKKSRIRETKHLSTDADSSTDAIGGWTKNTPKPDFFEKRQKNHSKRKNSKTSRNMPKLAIRPLTRGSNPSGSVFSGWTKNTQKPDFFEKGKNHPKRKNSKTSRDMPKLAIRPSTRCL